MQQSTRSPRNQKSLFKETAAQLVNRSLNPIIAGIGLIISYVAFKHNFTWPNKAASNFIAIAGLTLTVRDAGFQRQRQKKKPTLDNG